MDGHRRGAPWSAALSALLVISFLLSLTQPASATTTDWAATANGGSINSSDFTNPGNTIDSNSSTAGTYATYGSFCNAYGDAFAPYNRVSLVSSKHIVQVHVKVTYPCVGSGGTNASGVEIACGSGGTAWVKKFLASSASQDEDLDLSTGGTGYAGGCVGALLSVRYWSGGNGANLAIYDFRAYDAAQATPVSINQYCYDMQVGHPAFAWTGSCKFRQAFDGTITFTASSSAGSFKVRATGNGQYNPSVTITPIGGFGPGTGGAFTAGIDFEQDCYPLCQSATITMDVIDTTHNQTATYAFQRSSDGLVMDPTYVPVFTSYSGCYNVTTNQCGNSSAAGTTDIFWTWNCNLPSGTIKVMGVDQAPNCSGSDASVQIGPLNAATAGFTVTRYSVGTQAVGAYSALGLTTSTTQNRIWIIQLANPAGTTRGSVTLDFTSGGNTDTYTKPTSGGTIGSDGGETCAGLDFGCALRNFFNVGRRAVIDLVSGAVNELRDLALTRQPFNWIVRAFDGVSAQLGRAAAAVTTTSTCTGYVMVLPTSPPVHYNTPAATFTVQTWPTSVPAPSFAVLKCADLEPWGGTTWYQNIRAAMDPAIYLGWGLAQLRTLRRGPVAA